MEKASLKELSKDLIELPLVDLRKLNQNLKFSPYSFDNVIPLLQSSNHKRAGRILIFEDLEKKFYFELLAVISRMKKTYWKLGKVFDLASLKSAKRVLKHNSYLKNDFKDVQHAFKKLVPEHLSLKTNSKINEFNSIYYDFRNQLGDSANYFARTNLEPYDLAGKLTLDKKIKPKLLIEKEAKLALSEFGIYEQEFIKIKADLPFLLYVALKKLLFELPSDSVIGVAQFNAQIKYSFELLSKSLIHLRLVPKLFFETTSDGNKFGNKILEINKVSAGSISRKYY